MVYKIKEEKKEEVTELEGLEETDLLICTKLSNYWDYLKDDDLKDDEYKLTHAEQTIKGWLEIEGYWAYNFNEGTGKIFIQFPTHQLKILLSTKALKILQERYNETPRLYDWKQLNEKKKNKIAEQKAYELERVNKEMFCEHCGIIKDKCSCEKGIKERDVYE